MSLSSLEQDAKARIYHEFYKLSTEARNEISKELSNVSGHWLLAFIAFVLGVLAGLCL